jgi:protein CpxP
MKKLLITLLLLVGTSNYAQETDVPKNTKEKRSKQVKSPEQRGENLLAKLSTELNLDATQQAHIKPIIEEQFTKIGALRAQMKSNKDNNIELSADEKKEMRKSRMADKEATENKMKAILTAEQFVKYQAMQEAEKEKMKSQNKPK